MPSDWKYMIRDENLYIDYFLVNRQGELRVIRRAERGWSNPGDRDPVSKVMVTGLKGTINPNLSHFQGADGKQVVGVPETLKKYF